MIEHGFPEPFANALLVRYARYIGHTALTTSEVKKILGRPARAYAQWVADHADAFRTEQAGQAATDDAHGRRGNRLSRQTDKGADR